MDWLPIAFISVQAIVIAVLLAVVWSRGRALDEIGEALDAATGSAPARRAIPDRVEQLRRLRHRADAAELELGQRMRDLSYLADLVGVGIVRLTDDLRIEVANEAAHAFLGRDRGSMAGHTAIEGLGDHRVEATARAAKERGSATEEIALRGPDGPVLVVRARRSPILGVWLVIEDVAELRRLQRIRAEFIDNLSHELRTPITTIGLLAETLARDVDAAGDAVPDRMRERIRTLEAETATMAQMVAEMLELARIEGAGPALHLDDVSLGEIASGTVERLRPFAERSGVILEASVREPLPAVRGEAARLAQVAANLVHNAVKFSPVGGHVRVEVRAESGSAILTVADQGIGIAAADQQRIFERFYKADRSRSKAGGTGLGLAIARHIVEAHGGTIGVQSVEGSGATFTVTLPTANSVRAIRPRARSGPTESISTAR